MTTLHKTLAAGLFAAAGLGLIVPAALAAAPAATAPALTMKPINAHHAALSRKRVESVQEALDAGGAKLDIDGVWGPKTESALKQYQQQRGLKVTGHLDRATRERLKLG
jgi:peptidoglycan hydrolase-like protein with peptidoglycan-binding domain